MDIFINTYLSIDNFIFLFTNNTVKFGKMKTNAVLDKLS
jgi:hypothetical protein